MMDCTTETYDTLYARWLEKPGTLLDWAQYDPAKHVLLDLCGGTGAISKEALRRGAKKVWLADLNPRVSDSRIQTMRTRAEDLGVYWDPLLPEDGDGDSWNLVVCRQAIGYLNLKDVAKSLWRSVAPGARFVFNTFVKPRFGFKTYRHNNATYVEASGYLGKRVFHLQAMDGDYDVTSFKWWTDEDITEAFATGWAIQDFKRTASTLWYSFARLDKPS